MASVLMKTFPVAFRSLISPSTSRLQLLNSTYRTFERLGSLSLSVSVNSTPSIPSSTSGMLPGVKCYSSSCSCTCISSLKEHCSPAPSSKCYSLNDYSSSGLFSIQGKQRFSHIGPCCRSLSLGVPVFKKRELVTIHFINRDGEKLTVKTSTGQNLLDVVIDNDLDIDGYGACEGTLSCSTCHLIFSEELFKNLPKPSDEELDMLDLAYGQTDTSRLGCQVVLRKDMDGMTFVVPDGVSDARDV